jgi:transketolase
VDVQTATAALGKQVEIQFREHRDALGEALISLGAEYQDLVVVDPDVRISTRSQVFYDAYPGRYVCTGIAEQNAMGVAAGLASWGYIPVVPLYAVFAAGKAADQVLNSIAYAGLNVKIVGTHGGINVGPDGPSHQAIVDLGVMRSIPGMVVLTVADASEVKPGLRASLGHVGPVYLRLERAATPVLGWGNVPYEIGKGCVVRDGSDLAIIAIGSMVFEGLHAADELGKHGISARVINLRSLKPVDSKLIRSAAKETAGIITVEDHNEYGGLRSAVAEALAAVGAGPMRWVAVEDRFAESGTCSELRDLCGLTAAHIVEEALDLWDAREPRT